jgi:hypothetical protein
MKFQHTYEFDRLHPEGEYQFEIVEVDTDAIAKSGNPKISLTLQRDHQGEMYKIKDNVSFTGYIKKLCHLCRSAGIEHKYKSNEINNHDLIGKMVRARIVHTPKTNGDGKFCNIADYISEKNSSSTISQRANNEFKNQAEDPSIPKPDSDIPF